MKILHTIHLSNLITGEQYALHLIRPKKLTYTGAMRVLRKEGRALNSEITRIETAIYA
jgi:hypothetical protein